MSHQVFLFKKCPSFELQGLGYLPDCQEIYALIDGEHHHVCYALSGQEAKILTASLNGAATKFVFNYKSYKHTVIVPPITLDAVAFKEYAARKLTTLLDECKFPPTILD